MATILIEDIPAELHERLSEAASRHHRTVSEEALALLQRSLGNSRRRTELPPLLHLREPLTRELLERAKSEGRD
jgi:plasmid stability protein